MNAKLNATATITKNAAVWKGVALDRLTETGPRGGRVITWRAASKRDYQLALWNWTKRAAVSA